MKGMVDMNNYKRMTLNARGYLMNELRKIYNEQRVAGGSWRTSLRPHRATAATPR